MGDGEEERKTLKSINMKKNKKKERGDLFYYADVLQCLDRDNKVAVLRQESVQAFFFLYTENSRIK